MDRTPVTPEYRAALNARWDRIRAENDIVAAALRAANRKVQK